MNIPMPQPVSEGWHAILTAHLGPDVSTLAETAFWVAVLILAEVFRRYVRLLGLGGAPPGSLERRDYNGLRRSLKEGGWPSRVYGEMLTRLLDGVDRVFGDIDAAGHTCWERSAFPRAFGLKSPAALWTAAGYDRCLLLALIYPLVSVFAIWAVSGHVGPAETALGLHSEADPVARGLAFCGVSGAVLGWRFYARALSWNRWVWLVVTLLLLWLAGRAGAGAGAVTVTVTGTVAFTFAVASVGASASVVAGMTKGVVTGAVTVTVAAAAAAVAAASGAGAVAGLFAVAVAGVIARVVSLANEWSIKRGRAGYFQIILTTLILLLTIISAKMAERIGNTWYISSPLQVFLGLLTMINAPFDWISIGMTRGLLRRGVELQGWWPYGLAFVDLIAASGLLFALAAAMIVGVQAFDDLAALHGAPPVLPIPALLDGMARNPGAPEYWWVYATLFSTLIPSVFNLMMGAWSLTRGLPWVSRAMARALPDGQAVPIYNRWLVALVLTAQWAFGAILPLGAFILLAWSAPRLFPAIGHVFLDYARFVAGLDIPREVIEGALHLFGRR